MSLTRQRYTFDEWIDAPENTTLSELVEGIPVERMSTSSNHGWVAKALWRWLDKAEQAGFGIVQAGPVAVILDASGARRNVREPDFCFLRQERAYLDTGRAIEGVPDLIIEILSPTNRNDQLPGGEIWRDYERFAVPAYWIVDRASRTVTQYLHEHGTFREEAHLHANGVLASPLFPGITLPVDDLFSNLRGR